MQLVGDTIRKIEATRGEKLTRPMQIKTDIQLTNVELKELFAAGDKRDGAVVSYRFDVEYGSDSGKIKVEGSVFAVGEKKELTRLTKAWNKKMKKLDDDMAIPIINRAMELSYLTVIPLAKELKLPTPIQLPRFMKKEKDGEKASAKKQDYVG
tara:strand:+ start:130 stop:588 length:459 start_codon:yes stop_codon:yes gene_type:complete